MLSEVYGTLAYRVIKRGNWRRKMEKYRKCVKCQGRLFLELDYYDKRYDFVCIACGHSEPYVIDKQEINTSLPKFDDSRPKGIAIDYAS
jgi:hypothetical protein